MDIGKERREREESLKLEFYKEQEILLAKRDDLVRFYEEMAQELNSEYAELIGKEVKVYYKRTPYEIKNNISQCVETKYFGGFKYIKSISRSILSIGDIKPIFYKSKRDGSISKQIDPFYSGIDSIDRIVLA